MTTACIIQARMGSTRLPGKVLMPLGRTTVLGEVIKRCKAIVGVDVVCVAVPASLESQPIEFQAVKHGAVVVQGPEHDVLERYRIAADTVGADTIMRITSDCPLIDPMVAVLVLRMFQASHHGCGFASNDAGTQTWPTGLGVEVFDAWALWQAAALADEPSEREHVSPFIATRQPGKVLPCPIHDVSARRWTVDTAEDLEHVRAIYARLPPGRLGWSWIETMRAEDSL